MVSRVPNRNVNLVQGLVRALGLESYRDIEQKHLIIAAVTMYDVQATARLLGLFARAGSSLRVAFARVLMPLWPKCRVMEMRVNSQLLSNPDTDYNTKPLRSRKPHKLPKP